MEDVLTVENPDMRLGSLMRAARTGNQAAHAKLLHAVIPLIHRIVAPRCGHGLECDDVVQDGLMAVHAVRHTHDSTRPFTPWLAAIASHRLVDAYRTKVRVVQNETAISELPETFSPLHANAEMGTTGDPELLRRAISGGGTEPLATARSAACHGQQWPDRKICLRERNDRNCASARLLLGVAAISSVGAEAMTRTNSDQTLASFVQIRAGSQHGAGRWRRGRALPDSLAYAEPSPGIEIGCATKPEPRRQGTHAYTQTGDILRKDWGWKRWN